MPAKLLVPVTPRSGKQVGIPASLLYSGSRFKGHQKSKGNRYDVEVVLQVCVYHIFNNFQFSTREPAVYVLTREKKRISIEKSSFNCCHSE